MERQEFETGHVPVAEGRGGAAAQRPSKLAIVLVATENSAVKTRGQRRCPQAGGAGFIAMEEWKVCSVKS